VGIFPSARIRAWAAWPSRLDFFRWQWGGAKSWIGARLLGSWLSPGTMWSTLSAPFPPQTWQILPSRANTSLRSEAQSTGSRCLRVDPTHPPDFFWGIVGSHSLDEVEQAALDLVWVHLGAEDRLAGPLKFCVALVHMDREVHDMVASIVSKHPGRRRVILCLHSGGRKPTEIQLLQRASASCVAPMVQVLGRYAV